MKTMKDYAGHPLSCRVIAEVTWDKIWADCMAKGEGSDFAKAAALVSVLVEIEKSKRPGWGEGREMQWHPDEAEARTLSDEIWPFTLLAAEDARDTITEYACFREHDGAFDADQLVWAFDRIAAAIVKSDAEKATFDRIKEKSFYWTKLLAAAVAGASSEKRAGAPAATS